VANQKGSMAVGSKNKATGLYSFVTGYESEARGIRSFASGTGLLAGNQNMAAFGKYNDNANNDTLFEIGNGYKDSATNTIYKRNIFEARTDDTLVAPNSGISTIDNGDIKTLITKEYLNTYMLNSGGQLSLVHENDNDGYRLKGFNPDYYGDIGEKAIDLSASFNTGIITDILSTDHVNNIIELEIEMEAGLITDNNLLVQIMTVQDGMVYGSVTDTDNTGANIIKVQMDPTVDLDKININDAIDVGDNLDFGATGNYSFASGYKTSASGKYSASFNFSTQAQQDYSMAVGYCTDAIGLGSFSEGNHTRAQNDYMHAEGKFNIGTATDTIHEIGIGTSDIDRKNAFEAFLDGKLVAPELSIDLINDINTPGRVLVTREWVRSLVRNPIVLPNYPYRVGAAGQSTFYIPNADVKLSNSIVYVDGFKVPSDDYTISASGSGVNIELDYDLIQYQEFILYIFGDENILYNFDKHEIVITTPTNRQVLPGIVTSDNLMIFVEDAYLEDDSYYVFNDYLNDTTAITFQQQLLTNYTVDIYVIYQSELSTSLSQEKNYEYFIANPNQTTVVVSDVYDKNNIMIYIDGLIQNPSSYYIQQDLTAKITNVYFYNVLHQGSTVCINAYA
jgi:hypothetical protein